MLVRRLALSAVMVWALAASAAAAWLWTSDRSAMSETAQLRSANENLQNVVKDLQAQIGKLKAANDGLESTNQNLQAKAAQLGRDNDSVQAENRKLQDELSHQREVTSSAAPQNTTPTAFGGMQARIAPPVTGLDTAPPKQPTAAQPPARRTLQPPPKPRKQAVQKLPVGRPKVAAPRGRRPPAASPPAQYQRGYTQQTTSLTRGLIAGRPDAAGAIYACKRITC